MKKMKKYLKQIFTLKPPLGEAWLVIVGVLFLSIFGFVSLQVAAEWLIIATLFIGVFVFGALLQIWWQNRSK